MVIVRRLHNESAGFIKDVSGIIAAEAWKNPVLIPNLSSDKTLFIFSDYSRVQGAYKTYSFLVVGRSGADHFNGIRKVLRTEFGLRNRRMSYKSLNDRIKLRALPAFLSCAGAMNGLIITFAVDTKIKYMFAEQFLEAWPELASIKKTSLEDMLRVVHFGAQAVMTAFASSQNIVWFTDSDAIVANEECQQLFGKLAETVIRHSFMPQETIGRIVFGLSEVDDGSLEIEDFVAIPDLVAGALCDLLDELSRRGIRITPKVALRRPALREKTNTICEWIGNTRCPLKKFGVVFDKLGPDQWDFRPTVFSVQNLDIKPCEIKCNAQNGVGYMSDPIRFDIEDYNKRRRE
jgi:hypothetical protein